ncbi:Fe-S-containing protein [Caviibacterium pharyngocola]|uniref:DUF2318 domain-containing protein n=1 Tax=Caviibacterium pharyngocola TaxID=28159 RepID=A0A2M8RUT6_9PAST|nr:Fe-S-containing protein [Caviibacterium pharyngocola]PJG82647.1 DUF2318 domain-containing protein [Caviibacterium pharyngocola]
MNYYFVFLLQSILPLALLLGCYRVNYPETSIKKLFWLTFFGLAFGIVISLNYPTGQKAALVQNAGLLFTFVLFYVCQFFSSRFLANAWQFILSLIAGLLWAKDPNIAAITNTDVINTEFILHLSAVILGLFFCIFIAVYLVLLFGQSKKLQKLTALRLIIITVITALLIIPTAGELLLNLMKLQVLDLTKARLSFVAKAGNITTYFNYINAGLLLFIIAAFALKVYSPYKTQAQNETQPIEKRKKTALMRNAYKTLLWGVFAVFTLIGSQLYWDLVASQPPRLSEALPVNLDQNNNVRIPIEQVKDGKLHRFVWIAGDGKAVRFFIINRSSKNLSLAAVFDACILCGDQGYVMEGDQVVCVGCGVRMFIPSIGKPGGCNPVPIENWQQENGEVVISRKSLEDGLNYFSTIVELDVQDPVDGTKLKNTTAEHKYNYDGITYFFANEQNLNAFRDDPVRYIEKTGGAR